MNIRRTWMAPTLLWLAVAGPAVGTQQPDQPDQPVAPAAPAAQPPEAAAQPSSCMQCHGESDLWEGDMRKYYITEEHLAGDIHWQKGLRCHDCHGGNPDSELNARAAHFPAEKYPAMTVPRAPADVPVFCGRCHSNIEYMRHYVPSPRTDQEAEYWTSGHGQRVKSDNDPAVATCISCHGGETATPDHRSGHGILAVSDLRSPVYPTNVAQTCKHCHSDEKRMAGREYHGHPLGHSQYELWSKSVHADALLKKGDLSSATCNDCHGNHGAVPPEVGSVANACGTCHVKIAELFAQTRMKHKFETLELPGCVTCHGNHDIRTPSDSMLGMQQGAVCVKCHQEGKFGATLAGANEAKHMREQLEKLKQSISDAHNLVARAERLGMEVSSPRYDLRKANTALTNARTLIHSFALQPMQKTVTEGLSVTDEVQARAQGALDEYTNRRIWLGVSLVPIFAVVLLLLWYIRTLPVPAH